MVRRIIDIEWDNNYGVTFCNETIYITEIRSIITDYIEPLYHIMNDVRKYLTEENILILSYSTRDGDGHNFLFVINCNSKVYILKTLYLFRLQYLNHMTQLSCDRIKEFKDHPFQFISFIEPCSLALYKYDITPVIFL